MVGIVVVVGPGKATVVVAATSVASELHAVIATPSATATVAARALVAYERVDRFGGFVVWMFSSQVTL